MEALINVGLLPTMVLIINIRGIKDKLWKLIEWTNNKGINILGIVETKGAHLNDFQINYLKNKDTIG